MRFQFGFRSNGLAIVSEGSKAATVDFVPYGQIATLQEMGSQALYFKTAKNGYALFFKGIAEGVREEVLRGLRLMKDSGSYAAEPVRRLDVTAHFGAFELHASYSYYAFGWDTLGRPGETAGKAYK